MDLTQTQKLIATDKGRNILVSAGAGTGKTHVLVERFLNLVIHREALVTEILALTFTDKAAAEMKSRMMQRFKALGMDESRRDLEQAYISTFHAFAARVLKEHPIEACVDPDFRVIQSEEADILKDQALGEAIEKGCEGHGEIFELLKRYGEKDIRNGILKIFDAARVEGKCLSRFFEGYSSIPVTPRSVWHDKILSIIRSLQDDDLEKNFQRYCAVTDWDWALAVSFKDWYKPFSRRGGKNDKALWKELKANCDELLGVQIERFLEPVRKSVEKLALDFERVYEETKKNQGIVDFNDLEIKTLALFEKDRPANRKLRERYRKRFKFIMVDEFQDTSPVQARMVELLSSERNVFYVGDYKQSIYGFRGTSPEHFLLKEKEYEKSGEGIRIPLVENFRSDGPILEFINVFFENLWAEDSLPFEPLIARRHSEAEGRRIPELRDPSHPAGAQDDANHVPGFRRNDKPVEILAAKMQEEENLALARMREAGAVARRIREFHEQGMPFGDIVILFQAMTASAIYEQALKQYGIPYFVVSGRGFYHQLEIRDMMTFLAYLENPLSDIPLAALLRSPIFQVADDTLFHLARFAKEKDEMASLYHGLLNFEKIPNIPDYEKEKLRRFQSITGDIMAAKDRRRIAELLELILEKTSYAVMVLNDPQGVRKFANLKKLTALAQEYEDREWMTLGDFIRTIRNLENQEIRESEAQIEAEKSGRVVRCMTIHAAKGLEFPCVFVADLAYEKQSRDSKTFLAEPGLGYSAQVFNEKTREFDAPLSWSRIDRAIWRREREEWKRLLYVAMTRAKSKLILTGVYQEKKTEKESFHQMSSWMDWLMQSREVWEGRCRFEWIPEKSKGRHIFAPAEKKSFSRLWENFEPGPVEKLIPDKEDREWAIQTGEKIFEAVRPYEIKPSRVIDLPVSAYAAFRKDPGHYWQIYELGYERPEKAELDGTQHEEESLISDADFGTLIHRVLERICLEDPVRNFSWVLDQTFCGVNETKKAEAQKILQSFFASDLFRAIQKSRRVYRELPFILNERHGRIHGVIDLLFQDAAGAWHILDYKTAEGDPAKAAASGYETQIRLYALAVYSILKVIPATGILYFLKNQYLHSLTLDSRSLQEEESGLRKMQDSILFGKFSSDNPEKVCLNTSVSNRGVLPRRGQSFL